jgi:diguanylate cyclase (GGDEF)-like protein
MPHPLLPAPPNVSAEVLRLLSEAGETTTLADGAALARQAWDIAQTGSPLDRAVAGHGYCFFQYRLGAVENVLQIAAEVFPLLESLDLKAQYCQLAGWCSLTAADGGQFSLSIQYASNGCRLAEQWGDPRALAEMLSVAGVCFERSGDPWQGERLCRDSLASARKQTNPRTIAISLNNLAAVLVGKFYWLRDSEAEAEGRAGVAECIAYAREFLQIAGEMNDPFFHAIAYGNLSEWYVQVGEYEAADAAISQALGRCIEPAYFSIAQRTRCSLAELQIVRGQYAQAIAGLLEVKRLQIECNELAPVDTLLRIHHALYTAYRATNEASLALVELEALRVLETKRSVDSLKARSERMVTKIEANHSQQQLLAQANSLATQASQLEAIALQDELTGLGNRRLLDAKFPDIINTARATHAPLAVVMIDLDFFKRINDTLGHAMGDRVLVQVADLLRMHTRPCDLLVRTGGEEFVLVLPGISAEVAMAVCERLRLGVSQFHWDALSPNLSLTVSVGIACAPEYDMNTLLERADFAMYRAKRAGRNRVVAAI